MADDDTDDTETEHHPLAKSFCCPVCASVSFNPNDVREGYCGACHDWTGALENFLLLAFRDCEECGKPIACKFEIGVGATAPTSCAGHQ